MDIGKGLIYTILRDGYELFVSKSFDCSIISSDDSKIIKEIESHYNRYKKTPTYEYIEMAFQVKLKGVYLDEPMDFWIEHCKKKYFHNYCLKKSEEILELTNNNQIDHIVLKCKDLLEVHSKMNVSSTDEILLSSESFENYLEGLWNNDRVILTPWPSLNSRLHGGYKPGELICYAARPAVGKTNVLLLSAVKSWQMGKRVLIISTEMSIDSIRNRMLFFSKIAEGVSLAAIQKGMIDNHTKKWILKRIDEALCRENVRIVRGDFNLTVDSIEAKIVSFKPHVLFIDGVYLLKIKDERYMDKHQRIASIFDRLKSIAKKYDLPIIVTSQLNRGSKFKSSEKVDLERLAFSDNVGMVTDVTIFLNQDESLKSNHKMCFEMGKLREGDCYDDVIVNWDFMNNDFYETVNEEPLSTMRLYKL